MPDIAMCTGIRDAKSCPHLHECYRHNATPSPRQTYLVAPFKADGTCDHLWIRRAAKGRT